MFNSSMYFMPSIGSTKASPDVPTNNDIRLACTDATWVHSYGQHTEYSAVAQDGGRKKTFYHRLKEDDDFLFSQLSLIFCDIAEPGSTTMTYK